MKIASGNVGSWLDAVVGSRLAFVSVQDRRRRHVVEQGVGGGAVRHLAAGRQNGDRMAVRVGMRGRRD